jgi:ornithine cyclodeaminase
VLRGAWLRPGQHITALGADSLAKSELDTECFARAGLVVVDSRDEAPRNAGDLAGAIAAGAIAASGTLTEIGDLVLGRRPGRDGAGQITLAKFIGLGVQDLAAAQAVLGRLPGAGT